MLESYPVQIRQCPGITWYCDKVELTASAWWVKGVNGFVKRSLGFSDGYFISNHSCVGGKKESIHPV